MDDHNVNGVRNCVNGSKGEKIDESKILFESLLVARCLPDAYIHS